MFGRIRLTFDQKQLKFSEIYYEDDDGDKPKVPDYVNLKNLGMKFEPSKSISSGQICPILISAQHFNELSSPTSRLIIPALWGCIPRWHKGDFREHGFNTLNFRIENDIDKSRMYKPAFIRGKRCVLICEGYYEWMRYPAKLPVDERPIYFIRRPRGIPNLLHIAGIFDIWYDDDGNPLYSFTILSKKSNKNLNWLHPRMPVIFDTDQQVSDWLNFTQFSSRNALELIKNLKPPNLSVVSEE